MNAIDEYDADWASDWLGFDGTGSVDGYGPAGVGTLVLDLENGYKVRHRWGFDLQKFQSGKERRITTNDAPQEFYEGSAALIGDEARDMRATLARFAVQGQPFLLALPHEGIVTTESASGTLIFVGADSLDNADWATPGQRVVVAHPDEDDITQSIDAVIQSVGSDSIELDVSPGMLGAVGAIVMPARPILLEPQQSFARYPVNAAVWTLKARAAIFDFAPALAELDFGIVHPSMVGNILQSRVFGAPGESLFQLLTSPAYPAEGALIETTVLTKILARSGVTTMADVDVLLDTSALVRFKEFTPSYVIQSTDSFSGGLDGASTAGSQGRGAALTTYSGDGTERPVWDEPLQAETTATDWIQALTVIIDHGGIPYSVGTADEPDWGRSILFASQDMFDWQWLKLFMSTTLGSQESFWLPTWGDDMGFVSSAPGTVDVEVEDLRAWWPYQREHIQFMNADGSVTYAKVSAVVDNGDGTWTLSILDDAGDPITLAEDPALISWLELCRFETDEFEFMFSGSGLSLSTTARVVQQ